MWANLPFDVAAAIFAGWLLLMCSIGTWALGSRWGRKQGVADLDPEELAASLYRTLTPIGRPWAELSESVRDTYRDHADAVLDDLIGEKS
jgi:hypothetical protein